jgi:HD-GYP domain-containing protein (c-di-GMP phosphodiesterase class II)
MVGPVTSFRAVGRRLVPPAPVVHVARGAGYAPSATETIFPSVSGTIGPPEQWIAGAATGIVVNKLGDWCYPTLPGLPTTFGAIAGTLFGPIPLGGGGAAPADYAEFGRRRARPRGIAMLGSPDLSVALRLYLATVSVAGPTVALLAAGTGPLPGDPSDWLGAAILVAFVAGADRVSLHLTHKTHLSVSTAGHLAMVYAFPGPLPGLLALIATAIAEIAAARPRRDLEESCFNIGQTSLTVLLTGLLYAGMRDQSWLGPPVAGLAPLPAIAGAAVVHYVLNLALVTIAAALQLGTNPLRIWQVTIFDDFAAQGIMVALGVVAGYLTIHQPLMVLILALPLILVHRAVRETVQLRHDTRIALESLVEVVELRDPYTAGHSHRVAALARALALRLGLTGEEADRIESAGRVHDLGKVAIAPEVLTKTGPLDAAEWEERRRHPALGAEVIARFSAYREGHRLVRHHHEAWNGAGYPDQLDGSEIPLGARILAVADAYDAMTSARSYLPAKSSAEAVAILVAGAGKQWDARIVAALVAQLAAETAVATPRPEPSAASSPA